MVDIMKIRDDGTFIDIDEVSDTFRYKHKEI